MKYTLTGTCDCSRDAFIHYMFKPEHMKVWQKSLVSHEALSGEPGAKGSKSRLIHTYGKRRVEMIETVDQAKLPDAMTAIYEAPGAWNRVDFRFSDTPSGGTRWSMDSEFRCTGILRVMTVLFPGMFRRTSQKEMDSLRTYAEAASRTESK